MAQEKKLPFEIRLANAIGKYESQFGEHPPEFGYEKEELYQLLLNSLENNVEMLSIDEKIVDTMDFDDDVLIDT